MGRKATIFPRKVEAFNTRHKNSGRKLAFKYREEKENSSKVEGKISDFLGAFVVALPPEQRNALKLLFERKMGTKA